MTKKAAVKKNDAAVKKTAAPAVKNDAEELGKKLLAAKKAAEEAKAELKKLKEEAKKNKTPRAQKYTRQCALGDVLKESDGKYDRKMIIEKSDSLYVEKGGKSNLKEQTWVYGCCIRALCHMGYVAINDKGFHVAENINPPEVKKDAA